MSTMIVATVAAATSTLSFAGSTTVYRVADIPAPVRAALNLTMADPGQPYQATDVVFGKPLPFTRLSKARSDGQTWIVDYERGGIAHSFNRATIELVEGRYVVSDEWLKRR